MGTIGFGTSGWRGLLAEDFTFPNVRAVAQAIADHLRAGGEAARPVIVACDTHFLGDEFSRAAAEVLAGNGLSVVRSILPLPTPAVAWEVLHRRAAAAINITASHNPYQWNGVKFSPASGGPALPETTAAMRSGPTPSPATRPWCGAAGRSSGAATCGRSCSATRTASSC